MEADHRKVTRRVGFPGLGTLVAVMAITTLGAAAALAAGGGTGETSTCLDCHDGQSASLAAGPHAVLTGPAGDEPTRVSCTSCHSGASAHWEDDPEANPMSNPARMTAADAAVTCSACHAGVHQVNQQTLSPHAGAGVGCTDCHQVHGAPEDFGQLKEAQPALCYTCHGAVEGQFAQPSHHPVSEGMMSCTDCHLKSEDAMAFSAFDGGNGVCYKCHKQFQGPFPYEHQATVDYSVEGGGCAACHSPHGSPLDRMLTQPYGGPHDQLCTQCHTVPRHQFNSQHGADWADVACSECHTDIHGSYTSRLFLTPVLSARGCYAVGCHQQ